MLSTPHVVIFEELLWFEELPFAHPRNVPSSHPIAIPPALSRTVLGKSGHSKLPHLPQLCSRQSSGDKIQTCFLPSPSPAHFLLPFSNIRILSLFLMVVSEPPMIGKNTFIPFSQIAEGALGVSSELLAQPKKGLGERKAVKQV